MILCGLEFCLHINPNSVLYSYIIESGVIYITNSNTLQLNVNIQPKKGVCNSTSQAENINLKRKKYIEKILYKIDKIRDVTLVEKMFHKYATGELVSTTRGTCQAAFPSGT